MYIFLSNRCYSAKFCREDGMFLSVDPDRMASLEGRCQLIWICRLLSKKDKQIQVQQDSEVKSESFLQPS